jgi:hypothetical protein
MDKSNENIKKAVIIKIIIIPFFLFLKNYTCAQWITPTVIRDIDSLEIVDKDFKPILDTIISTEKQRSYYKGKTIYFFITNTNLNEIYITTEGLLYEDDYITGLFIYNGEKFLVENNNWENTLLKKTGIKVKQDFDICGEYIIEETGEKVKIGRSMLDDSRSIWVYKYNGEGKLELVEFVNTF